MLASSSTLLASSSTVLASSSTLLARSSTVLANSSTVLASNPTVLASSSTLLTRSSTFLFGARMLETGPIGPEKWANWLCMSTAFNWPRFLGQLARKTGPIQLARFGGPFGPKNRANSSVPLFLGHWSFRVVPFLDWLQNSGWSSTLCIANIRHKNSSMTNLTIKNLIDFYEF